jgi:hypothetical protein
VDYSKTPTEFELTPYEMLMDDIRYVHVQCISGYIKFTGCSIFACWILFEITNRWKFIWLILKMQSNIVEKKTWLHKPSFLIVRLWYIVVSFVLSCQAEEVQLEPRGDCRQNQEWCAGPHSRLYSVAAASQVRSFLLLGHGHIAICYRAEDVFCVWP